MGFIFGNLLKTLLIHELPYLLELWPRGTIIFLPKNKDKTLQIVPHCDIIQGCATIKFYTHVHTTLLKMTFFIDNNNSYNYFNCVTHGDHTCKAIWMLDIGGALRTVN